MGFKSRFVRISGAANYVFQPTYSRYARIRG